MSFIPDCDCWVKMCGPGESPIKMFSGLWNWANKRVGDIYYRWNTGYIKGQEWQFWWLHCPNCGKPAKEVDGE